MTAKNTHVDSTLTNGKTCVTKEHPVGTLVVVLGLTAARKQKFNGLEARIAWHKRKVQPTKKEVTIRFICNEFGSGTVDVPLKNVFLVPSSKEMAREEDKKR